METRATAATTARIEIQTIVMHTGIRGHLGDCTQMLGKRRPRGRLNSIETRHLGGGGVGCDEVSEGQLVSGND